MKKDDIRLNASTEKSTITINDISLDVFNLTETSMLISMLNECHFKGSDVTLVYGIAQKLIKNQLKLKQING